jgi:hypothetical protein
MVYSLTVELESDEVRYIPAPCRGTVIAARAVWQTNVVEPNDTIILARNTTAVNTITAVDTAGLQTETGVPTSGANQYLIFDPASATKANTVIKVTPNGGAGDAIVTIDFSDAAYVAQSASEA